ncbi:MAG: TIGR01777 family oxidoreductase [Terrimesophilobacter sp.]
MSIEHSSVLASPIDDVFEWHARPGAFTRLAPPWQPVALVSESESLADGTAVLQLPGGLTWVSRHDPSGYNPPHRFVDVIAKSGLTSLPVAALLHWRHSHDFDDVDETHTRMTDRVKTPIGSRALRPMFRYRHRQLAEDLAAHRWGAAMRDTPMTVAVTGSTGLIGTALCAFLTTGGHTVIRLVRRPANGAHEREWNPANPAATLLEGVDALVHLAGESIANRFTEKHKRAVRESRIEPTRLLAELAAATPSGPKVFLSASAIGIYGADRGDERVNETSTPGDGFLADVVAEWEGATAPASTAGIRVAMIRTGIVQAAQGGSLKIYRPLYSAGLGGKVAGGQQWVSWIDIDDLLDVYLRALLDDRIVGPVNAVAPTPVRNAEYAKVLARVLKRPAILPVPALGPRILLGTEGSKNIVEGGQFVVSASLATVGHTFRRDELEASLRHQLGRLLPPSADELTGATP